MQTGGEALERYAEGRASAAVRALEEAAPRIAHVVRARCASRTSQRLNVVIGDVLLDSAGRPFPATGS